jgi:D-amino peptidase
MTDLEGVSGVLNFEEYCTSKSAYYDLAKELLTREVNAAIEGFIEGGAREIAVADAHGYGGIAPALLHPAAELIGLRGQPWPLLLEERKYDAIAWVGQHAKSGTINAHLAHTQDFVWRDESINGISVGEFGQLALCASELKIRAIFGSGDEAFTREAQQLVPGIETAATKRGINPDPGHALPRDAYERFNLVAIHFSPQTVRERIRAGARRAVERAAKEPFGLINLNPPYERVVVFRSSALEPPRIARNRHPSSISALLNMPLDLKPIEGCDPLKSA